MGLGHGGGVSLGHGGGVSLGHGGGVSLGHGGRRRGVRYYYAGSLAGLFARHVGLHDALHAAIVLPSGAALAPPASTFAAVRRATDVVII